MTWTRSIAPDAATGDAAQAFDRLRERSSRRHVSNVWQALALDPRSLTALFALRSDLLDDPAPLTVAQVEGIAVIVSATNGCGYSVTHHGPRMGKAYGDEALARRVAADYREADLPARDRVLLDYAIALTCEPSERTQADVERVREYGFGDEAILKATVITAFFNAMNRIVSGLGVPLEDGIYPWEFRSPK